MTIEDGNDEKLVENDGRKGGGGVGRRGVESVLWVKLKYFGLYVAGLTRSPARSSPS